MSFQPDISTQNILKRQRRIPFGIIQRSLFSKQLSAQLRQVPYVKDFNVPNDFNVPKLVVPANPNRMGLTLGFITELGGNPPTFYASYNYPTQLNPPGTPNLPNFGIIISGTPPFNFPTAADGRNGTVSVDDIYVTMNWNKNIPPGNGNISILFYEGVLAVEGRNNRIAA